MAVTEREEEPMATWLVMTLMVAVLACAIAHRAAARAVVLDAPPMVVGHGGMALGATAAAWGLITPVLTAELPAAAAGLFAGGVVIMLIARSVGEAMQASDLRAEERLIAAEGGPTRSQRAAPWLVAGAATLILVGLPIAGGVVTFAAMMQGFTIAQEGARELALAGANQQHLGVLLASQQVGVVTLIAMIPVMFLIALAVFGVAWWIQGRRCAAATRRYLTDLDEWLDSKDESDLIELEAGMALFHRTRWPRVRLICRMPINTGRAANRNRESPVPWE